MIYVVIVVLALAGGDSSAKRAFEDAKRSYNVGNFPAAASLFNRAYLLSGHAILLFNAGQAYRQAGDIHKALVAYRAYLREMPTAHNRITVENKIRELEEKSRDKPDAPNRAGVEIRIRELEAAKPGPSVPSTAAPAPSDIADPFETGIYARPTVPPAREREVSSTPPRRRTLVWIGAGATVAFAGGAVLAGLAARSRFDDLRDTCGRTGCPESEIDTVKSRALAANVLWVLAGVSAAATGVVFYLDHRGGGLALTRRF